MDDNSPSSSPILLQYRDAPVEPREPRWRGVGPLGTGVLASIPAVFLLWYGPQIIPNSYFYLVGGHYSFSVGGLHVSFVYFSIFSVLTIPFLVVARFCRSRRSLAAYWALLIPSTIVCVYLLLFLTVTTVGLLKYIATMGLTLMRTMGCGFAGFSYLAILGLLTWIIWPLRR